MHEVVERPPGAIVLAVDLNHGLGWSWSLSQVQLFMQEDTPLLLMRFTTSVALSNHALFSNHGLFSIIISSPMLNLILNNSVRLMLIVGQLVLDSIFLTPIL